MSRDCAIAAWVTRAKLRLKKKEKIRFELERMVSFCFIMIQRSTCGSGSDNGSLSFHFFPGIFCIALGLSVAVAPSLMAL